MPFQGEILSPAHVTVRWTEEICFHQFIRLVRIGKIIVGQIFESADMIECMVSDAVAAIYYHLEYIGMLAYIVSHHEEGGFDVMFIQ